MAAGSEAAVAPPQERQKGFLAFVERAGNLLPEPAMIFVYLIAVLVVLSAIGDWAGWSATLQFAGEKAPEYGTLANGVLTFEATSLLSAENVGKLLSEMPRTVTGFAPLGLILVIMLGAAVAERSGMLAALIRVSLAKAPRALMTPVVALIGMVSHHASDAAYIVFIPLAAITYAAVGRHPLVGLAAAFGAVSGGYAGNVAPGQIDVLLFGFTQEAARIVDPGWAMNPLGNWWFILGIVAIFTPAVWYITDKVIEPRLGAWDGEVDTETRAELERSELTGEERKGLRRAGLAALVVTGLFAALMLLPGYHPLINEEATGPARLQPFYAALIAFFFLLFLFTGIAFGSATGTVRNSTDVVTMMQDGIKTIAPYLVFVFFAAHFVAMFNWSRLGPILAINGAEALQGFALPSALLLVSVLLLSSFLDLFIGSASAKWSALAPVVVPMFMLLGISPEMTTAAYRMGDSYTNIMTPLMSYFPLVLAFARRWDKDYGVGSLLALMLPYALTFMVLGIGMTVAWVTLDLPLGPGAGVFYQAPTGGQLLR
ncbi:AbgT family transporter [Sphingomonas sp. LHG3406-1]|uniref:AbgT family transporter n=1 Tax=Sphingomonas sp. LHG3406-1 TaxID=2804617 RepID=UPI00260C5995|nr:AbgT family transporter [Sphingomonas sp. LHG3406-1]